MHQANPLCELFVYYCRHSRCLLLLVQSLLKIVFLKACFRNIINTHIFPLISLGNSVWTHGQTKRTYKHKKLTKL